MTPNYGSLTDSRMHTLQLHQQGLSLEEIAKQRNLPTGVIVEHLINLMSMSQPVDINRLVALSSQQAIIRAIETVGDTELKIIYDHLNGQYSYNQIRLVRAFWRQYRIEF